MNDHMSSFPHERIINPIYDEGFKLIFGREDVSEPLIMDLLNSIFADDPVLGNITEVRFTNTEKPNELKDGRGLRYDIRCITSTGHHFIVEMQKAEQQHFTERCIYYLSRDIAEQGYKGFNESGEQWDFSLTPVIGLFFCNFSVRDLADKPVSFAKLIDEDTGKPIGDYVRCVFIQLPWFQKAEGDCDTKTDKWIYNIKNMGSMQAVAFKTHEDIFRYLDSISSVAALDPRERDVYEAALMRARDYNAQMKFAREKAHTKGRAEGIAEGRAQGIALGRAEGLAEGLAEGREEEKKKMILNMKSLNIPLETIAAASGMSIEEIKNLTD